MMGKLILYGGIVLRDASITSWPSDAKKAPIRPPRKPKPPVISIFKKYLNDAKGPHRPIAFLKIHGRV